METYVIRMDESDLENGMEVKVLRPLPDGRMLRVAHLTVFPLGKGYSVDTIINPVTQQASFMGWRNDQRVFRHSVEATVFCVEVSPLNVKIGSDNDNCSPDNNLYEASGD